MRHPCNVCEEEAGHEIDKRSAACRACNLRSDYADYAEGRVMKIPESLNHCLESAPPPKNPEPYGDRRAKKPTPVKKPMIINDKIDPTKPPEPAPDSAIRSKVCAKCGGDPKPISEFSRHATTKDGFMNICKECQCKIRRARPAHKTGKFKIEIDFIDHQDFYKILEEHAKNDLRSVKKEALYLLIKSLQ
jgi:hypothetical protein